MHAQRPPLSVAKLTRSGAEVKFGSKGPRIDLHTDACLCLCKARPMASRSRKPMIGSSLRQMTPSPRQLGQPLSDGGLSSGSSVEDMRNRLRALGTGVGNEGSDVASTGPRRGKTVPESSQKQEDKGNSVCHELQTNHQPMSKYAMKSHTYRVNRGVHGASWCKVVQNRICSDQWKV